MLLRYAIETNEIYWNKLKACLKRRKGIKKTELIVIYKKKDGEKIVINIFSNMSCLIIL